MKTATDYASRLEVVLNHKNWTGQTLLELVQAGCIIPSDKRTLKEWMDSAMGPAPDLAELKHRQVLLADLQAGLERRIA